ncbi:hypothetical protein H6G96_37740 [Nostoc sp. FACHB-892]|uniref:hypothetical protein n=1 Tax=Nostoc sp. FACHB-892 TaxID=2692843 RepID=UPI00168304BD|nr:hypothetical protein [Nostoc sp. FACHB-892]MBD2731862.1 hypothetical protein [Nostoc sp. FACHB-892]
MPSAGVAIAGIIFFRMRSHLFRCLPIQCLPYPRRLYFASSFDYSLNATLAVFCCIDSGLTTSGIRLGRGECREGDAFGGKLRSPPKRPKHTT